VAIGRLVIVGASLAGLRAAQAARAAGFDGELVAIGAERHLPYTRPPLSKELLKGEQEPEQCLLGGHEGLGAEWRLGVRAAGLERSRREVVLEDGETVRYERLVVATGCRARPWLGPGAELAGVHTLRALDDALVLRAALERGEPLVIVGAGFIGCEVAASARARGVQVTLIDVLAQPMPALGPELGRRCARLHAERGVRLRLGAAVRALRGHRRVEEVELASGQRIPASRVLVALGALANDEWLERSGLRLERSGPRGESGIATPDSSGAGRKPDESLVVGGGICADRTLTALGDPDVLVAGDVASWPHPLAGGRRVRIEHWTNAVEQGQLAGRNALLAPEQRRPHETVPYFWSDQYEVKIQAAGFPALGERVEVLESSEGGERLVAVCARGERAVGVVAFNAAARLARYRRELARAPTLEQLRELARADERALGAPAGVAL
jgi:3-phenylpropionate/trans-cinnamate dioxygenase ferredoxin reductase subunit